MYRPHADLTGPRDASVGRRGRAAERVPTQSNALHAAIAITSLASCTRLVGTPLDGSMDASTSDMRADASATCLPGLDAARGSRDPSWTSGVLRISFSLLRGAVVDTVGRTYVFGSGNNCVNAHSGQDLLVMRHNADGTRDVAFGSNGISCFDGEPNAGAQWLAAGFDDRGRLHLVGQVGVVGNTVAVLARLTDDGRLDPSFNGGQLVEYAPIVPAGAATTGEFAAIGITIATDGIYVNGVDWRSLGFVARFATDGTPDVAFAAATGAVDATVSGWFAGTRSGRNIYVAGTRIADQALVVRRVGLDGAVDSTFGRNGYAIALTGEFARPRAIAVRFDGSIDVGGGSQDADVNLSVATVARFASSGEIDAAFGTSGVFRSRNNFNSEYTFGAMLETCDGRVLMGSVYRTRSGAAFPAIEWLDANGVLDRSVSVNGAYVGMDEGEAPIGLAYNPLSGWVHVVTRHGLNLEYAMFRVVP